MFIKCLKLIDNKVVMAQDVKCPSRSKFVYIFCTKVVILEKMELLKYFRLYRKVHDHEANFKYSIEGSLNSFQVMDLPLEDKILFDHCIYDIKRNLPINRRKNNKRVHQIQQQQEVVSVGPTEVFWMVQKETQKVYFLDGSEFKLAITIDHKIVNSNKCFGKLNPSKPQLQVLSDNVLTVYALGLRQEGSSYSVEMTLDFSQYGSRFIYLSLTPQLVYGESGIFQVDEFGKVIEKHRFDWKSRGTEEQKEDRFDVQADEYQFSDGDGMKLFTFAQPSQRVYLQVSEKTIQKNQFQGVRAIAFSNLEYIECPRDKGIQELKVMDFSKDPKYRILAVSSESKFIEGKKKKDNSIQSNWLSFYRVNDGGEESLICIMKDLPHLITTIQFVNGYSLMYRNSNSQVGLITMSINDFGMVLEKE